MQINQLITAINPQVQQVEKKLKPLEIINIDKVSKVLGGKKILDSTEDEIKQKLKLIYLMIGLRPHHFPENEEKQFLHQYIFEKYGNKTLDEITLAFDLAIQGQLDVDDIKVYDQFSCEYLAKIMNGYRKWLLNVFNNLKTIKKEPMLTVEDKKQMSNEEWEEWIIDIKKYPMEAIPNMLYEYLERVGKIKFSNTEKHEFMSSAINVLMVKLEGRDALEFIAMKNTGKFNGRFLASLQTIAKKIAAKKHLDESTL
jgi:hypothetical protein